MLLLLFSFLKLVQAGSIATKYKNVKVKPRTIKHDEIPPNPLVNNLLNDVVSGEKRKLSDDIVVDDGVFGRMTCVLRN